MPVITPVLVLSAVQAGVKVYQAADRSAAQMLRDKPLLIRSPVQHFSGETPASESLSSIIDTARDDGELRAFYRELPGLRRETREIVSDYEFLNKLERNAESDVALKERIKKIYTGWKNERTEVDNAIEDFRKHGQDVELNQFLKSDDPNKPISPLVRFTISVVDAAAGFVAVNPTLIANGSSGAILVSSFAGQLGTMLPDDGMFGSRDRLGTAILATVLKAGLGTLNEYPGSVVEKEHSAKLVEAFTKPILDSLPEIPLQAVEIKFDGLIDTIVGPATSAAFAVLAENQKAFLGSDLALNTLAGSLLNQVFQVIVDDGLENTFFTEAGAVAIYQAVLEVFATKPELVFLGSTVNDEFTKNLLQNLAEVLQDYPLFWDRDSRKWTNRELAQGLAVAAIEAFKENANALLRLNDELPLEKAASAAINYVLDVVADGIGEGEVAKYLGSETGLGVIRIFLRAAAQNPELILDARKGQTQELQTIVAAVLTAVVDDKRLLLHEDGWKTVLETVLTEAGRNPGRLFGFSTDNPKGELGALAISTLLSNAAGAVGESRETGAVLKGDVLEKAIVYTIGVVASNPSQAALAFGASRNTANLVGGLADAINKIVAVKGVNNQYMFGSKEWLRLYRTLLPMLFAGLEIEIDGAGNPMLRWVHIQSDLSIDFVTARADGTLILLELTIKVGDHEKLSDLGHEIVKKVLS